MSEIIKLNRGNISAVAPLFAGMSDTAVWSCLQGRNFVRAWTDSVDHTNCACLMTGGVREGTGGFAFFAGDAAGASAAELVKRWKSDVSGGHITVPRGEAWRQVMTDVLGKAGWHKRYATSKSENNFDIAKLSRWANALPEGFNMRKLDRELFELCLTGGWSRDNVGNFADYDEFATQGYGMGFAVMLGGEPVSVASPYSAYDSGIEIEIDTREDQRRKGLARACASRLILECLEKGLYPSWDAANRESILLAQQLGYIFTEEYDACFCRC